MLPELTAAFGLSTMGVSSLLGLYYYTYSTFALVSGASLDRWGARYTIPIRHLPCVGLIMFGVGVTWMAYFVVCYREPVPRLPLSAQCICTHGFPARYLATAILHPMHACLADRRTVRRRAAGAWRDELAAILFYSGLLAL